MAAELTALANSLISIAAQNLGVKLGFDEKSVEWLDGYIQRIRLNVDEASIEGLSNSIGAFLGECVIANYGGSWRQSDDGAWGVFFDEKNAIFPFAKAQKQIMNGHEDSILSMYTMIPLVFNKSHDAERVVAPERG